MSTPPPASADAAVVVCTRDRAALLADLVPALVAIRDAGSDVVVVDSASRDTAATAPAARAGLTVVRCDTPGASRARNAGVAACRAPVVAFTDDDCRPRPDWLDRLVAAFADADVGFVTGQVLPGAGAGRAMSPMTRATPARWSGAHDAAAVADMGHAANLAVRRTALDAVGGFDELLGAGAPLRGSEDKDLLWRLLRAGVDGCFAPDAVVEHAAWRAHREALRTGYGYGVGIGAWTVKTTRLTGSAGSAGAVLAASGRSLRQVGAALRAGHRFGAANLAVRAVGTLVGGARAARLTVEDGRFARRGR